MDQQVVSSMGEAYKVNQKLRADRLARKEARVQKYQDRLHRLKVAERQRVKLTAKIRSLQEQKLLDSISEALLPLYRGYKQASFSATIRICKDHCSLICSSREEAKQNDR